ncbi:hypothetical protein AVEN_78707-1 [Araneus ventricosus]|uniref:Uncharacterized protein n=1 Tax=Araneus ventricosus TaxID=182803 RepID=A0A4Y2P976_ARAVE|nr:hypothetical protein AVEN_83292-1 [Araneus ventricosus]GBN47841.1 hypothetical protein AVEN_125224-1 [Araneus ventricosus]GBN47853.1 hypothetical protein AVEN_200548-1 [Araneus ventricosus]GBN47992.1 hypothetical protein AVEN_78707-1 [Araneus ventricosus]
MRTFMQRERETWWWNENELKSSRYQLQITHEKKYMILEVKSPRLPAYPLGCKTKKNRWGMKTIPQTPEAPRTPAPQTAFIEFLNLYKNTNATPGACKDYMILKLYNKGNYIMLCCHGRQDKVPKSKLSGGGFKRVLPFSNKQRFNKTPQE